MSKHRTRFRILAVVAATALVTSISAAGAEASQQDSSWAVASSTAGHAQAATSALAPCTTPLFGTDKDCESTSPVVDRWVTFHSGAQSCTYTQFVDWGDGTSSSRTFVDPIPDLYLIASHAYKPVAKTTTYTETVTSSVDSGTCEPIDTTVFKFTYLVPVQVPWWTQYGITKACAETLIPDPIEVGLGLTDLGLALALFAVPGGQVVDVLFLATDVGLAAYRMFQLLRKCPVKSDVITPLVHDFSYGASHLGKLFKPSPKAPAPPHITAVTGYQKGSLVYFSLSYADPGHDAKGFGFVGINGAGWKEENHPFSSPSYGIVGKNRIDYPFNLGCGTAHQYKSYVEAWIYDSQGIRSNPVEVALTCTT